MHFVAVEHGERLDHVIEKQRVTGIRVQRPNQTVPFSGGHEARSAPL